MGGWTVKTADQIAAGLSDGARELILTMGCGGPFNQLTLSDQMELERAGLRSHGLSMEWLNATGQSVRAILKEQDDANT